MPTTATSRLFIRVACQGLALTEERAGTKPICTPLRNGTLASWSSFGSDLHRLLEADNTNSEPLLESTDIATRLQILATEFGLPAKLEKSEEILRQIARIAQFENRRQTQDHAFTGWTANELNNDGGKAILPEIQFCIAGFIQKLKKLELIDGDNLPSTQRNRTWKLTARGKTLAAVAIEAGYLTR